MRKLFVFVLLLVAGAAYGQLPGLNNEVRNKVLTPTRIANALDGIKPFTATGTDTYAVTVGLGQYSGAATYAANDVFTVVIANANTSTTVTLNVDGEGAVAVKDQSGNDLAIADLKAGGTYTFRYNGTHFRVLNLDAGGGGGGGGSGTVNSGNQYRIGYYAGTGTVISEAAAITSGRAIISDANGVPTNATTTATEIGYLNGVTSAIQTQINSKTPSTRSLSTTSPLSGGGDLSSDRTLSIANAAADGSTKGAASFTANDFDASSGNIGIDYTNGQKASASVPGFVSTSAQEFAGVKTVTSPVFKTDLNYSDGTTTKNFSISSKSTPTTFPVVVVEPNATSNTNNRIAVDIMPSGSTAPTTDYDGLGTISWIDLCDESKTNILSNQAHSLRLGIGAGDAMIRSVAFNGATARPLSLAIGNTPYLTVLNTGRIQFPFYTALDDQLSGALANTKYLFVGSGSGIVYQIPGDKLKVTDPTTAADANLVTALGQMWKITGTTTLSGSVTIAGGSNRSPLTYTGSWTANANNQYFESMAPTLTASATTSDNLNILRIGGSLTSGANGQTLNGVLIENTFVNGGSHTGLTNNYLKVVGTNTLFAVSQSQSLFGNTTNTNTVTIATSGSDLALTGAGSNDFLISHGTMLAFKPGSANLLQLNTYSGQLHTQLMPFSSGATTSAATQRSSTNLNLTITEWTGSVSQTNFWTHRATMSSSVNQESYYDLYYGQGSSLPSLANMLFRLKNNGDLLLGATSTSATPSGRLHVTGGGTTTGKTVLFEASDGTDKFTFVDNGDFQVDKTVTGAGTTGDRTINKLAGTVNFAAAATTLTVTNSLVTTSSLVFCEIGTNDATATIKNVVAGSGSFVITLSAAATAETLVRFFIVN